MYSLCDSDCIYQHKLFVFELFFIYLCEIMPTLNTYKNISDGKYQQ